jgi:LysE type translocator
MFVSNVHVLAAACLMGLAAAAPMGPVNMLAIRRGMIGGWRHTLACGIGSVAGDLFLLSLVLLGGRYLLSDLSNPTLQTVLAGHRRDRNSCQKFSNTEIVRVAVRFDDSEADLMVGLISQLLPGFSETLRLPFGRQHR